jgi:glycosyltransferase involved in cell wall biosynthesis
MSDGTEIFKRVLYIGPSIKAKGGIASVLQSYKDNFPIFNYLPTNSRYGTIPGLFVLVVSLIRLVFIRLFTSIEIVHIHGASGKSWIRKTLFIKLANVLGFKVIWHCHGGKIDKYFGSKDKKKIRAILDKCSAVVVLTDEWKRYFMGLGCNSVYVINNFIADNSAVYNKEKTEVIKLLFLGNIAESKGIFDVVDVFKLHSAEFANRVELIVGGLGDSARLQSEIDRNGLNDVVKYVGWISGNQKVKLLNQASIVILTSYFEGLPISILEGMSYHCPIIASEVGGIPTIVHNRVNGVLLNAGDKDAIYRAIMRYINNPDLIEAEGEQSAMIVKEYLPQSVMRQLIALYND